MKLKNILIVVKDIEKSKKFYHDLFGLEVILDNDGNVTDEVINNVKYCVTKGKTWRKSL